MCIPSIISGWDALWLGPQSLCVSIYLQKNTCLKICRQQSSVLLKTLVLTKFPRIKVITTTATNCYQYSDKWLIPFTFLGLSAWIVTLPVTIWPAKKVPYGFWSNWICVKTISIVKFWNPSQVINCQRLKFNWYERLLKQLSCSRW